MFTWHHLGIVSAPAIAVIAALVSVWQAQEARRAANYAQEQLALQTPTVTIVVEKNIDQDLEVRREPVTNLYKVSLPITVRFDNSSISPVGVSSLQLEWSGIDMSFLETGELNNSNKPHSDKAVNKPPLHISAVFPDTTETSLDPRPPFSIDAGKSEKVKTSLAFTFISSTFDPSSLCNENPSSNTPSRVNSVCSDIEHIKFRNLQNFENAVSNLRSGNDMFGWSASTNEITKDQPLELVISARLQTGKICNARYIWHWNIVTPTRC